MSNLDSSQDDDYIPSSQIPNDIPSREFSDISDAFSSGEDELLISSCVAAENEHQQSEEKAKSAERFAEPITDDAMVAMSETMIPTNTKKNLKWACTVFEDWKEARNEKIRKKQVGEYKLSVIDIKLEDLHDDELNFCLCRFVCEVRRGDGKEYPPKTLRQLVLLIQMHLNNRGRAINFLSDPMFRELKNTLDNQMKIGASHGHGLHTRQADVITVDQEDHLWKQGLLGADNPQMLLDTMVFLLGLNFALRSSEEHRTLTVDQFELGSNAQGEYLLYTETVSKCNQGGLKNFRVSPKSVTAYDGPNPDRSIVHLFRKYVSLRPANAPSALYLRPLIRQKETVWYAASPIGQHTLSKTIRRLCTAAGFNGFYTNHSLRATCATRLFHEGIDEQLIARTTGHRSNAIREYKRVSEKQDEMVSNIIQNGSRKRARPSDCPENLARKSVQITFNIL